MPFYERQPYIQPLHSLVGEILDGQILVPRFQRPGTEVTWTPDQRGQLLDSIYRGFPVGTILLWATNEPIATLPVVGGFPIMRTSAAGPNPRLLLDGHQRLSTLVQLLGPGVVSERKRKHIPVEEQAPQEERWVFELGLPPDVRSRERFILLKPSQKPSRTQLPLDRVLDLAALNRWVREHQLSDAETNTADELRTRLREYQMPVAILAADSLDEATESFKRVNSSGTPMNDYHMAVALAYETNKDPREEFDRFRAEHLDPLGWGEVPDQDLLRVFAGRIGQNPAKLEIDKLAANLKVRRDDVSKLLSGCVHAVAQLGALGVHGPKALPYTYQFITLAVVLGERTDLDADAHARVEDWFWVTTYGEVYGSVKSSSYDRARTALDEMLAGGGWESMRRDVAERVTPVRRFDFRAARSKACALAMAEVQDGGNRAGPAHRALATEGVHALKALVPSGARTDWSNRAIAHPERDIGELRAKLKAWAESGHPQASVVEIGVPEDTSGDIGALLERRAQAIEERERTRITELGLRWEDNPRSSE